MVQMMLKSAVANFVSEYDNLFSSGESVVFPPFGPVGCFKF
jgi:hypothetical protein